VDLDELFMFTETIWEKFPETILTHIFQRGLVKNHQPAIIWRN